MFFTVAWIISRFFRSARTRTKRIVPMDFARKESSDVEDDFYFCLPDPVCSKCHKSCETSIWFPNVCFHKFCFNCHFTIKQRDKNKWILVCPICAENRRFLTGCPKKPLAHQWNNFRVEYLYTWEKSVCDFRKLIYEQKVFVEDFFTTFEGFREFTPEFYRNHGSQIYRLIPWLKRELCVVLDCPDKCGKVAREIISMLPRLFIRSQEFKVAVEAYFGDKTDHFIHEFYMFACSFCDIYGYDEHAYYFLNVDKDSVLNVDKDNVLNVNKDNSDMAKIDNREDSNTTQIKAFKINCYMYLQKAFISHTEKRRPDLLQNRIFMHAL